MQLIVAWTIILLLPQLMCFFFLAKVEGRKTDKIIKEAYQTRHG